MMKRRVVWGMVCAAMVAGVLGPGAGVRVRAALAAEEKPPADYVAAMRTFASVSKGLTEALAAEDADRLDKLVIEARPALLTVEQYWTARKVEEAVEIAQRASKAIAEISVAVHLMSDGPNPIAIEGAQDSAKTFQATCAACHTAHRVTLPDGSFAIK